MFNIKVTNQEVLNLNRSFRAVGGLKGPRFVYVIARNISIIRDAVKALQASLKPTPEFMVYDKLRVELAEKCAVKENGVPKKVIHDQVETYVMENQTDFDFKLMDLQKDYVEVVAARKAQLNGFNALLKDEVELSLYRLKEEDLPEDITGQQLADITVIVEFKEEKK